MARKMTFLSVVRAMERSVRASDADNRRRQRDTERQQRRYEIAQRKNEREALLQYKEYRKNEAENMTRDACKKLALYSKIVLYKTKMPKNFFDSLRMTNSFESPIYYEKQFVPSIFDDKKFVVSIAKEEFGHRFIGVAKGNGFAELAILNVAFFYCSPSLLSLSLISSLVYIYLDRRRKYKIGSVDINTKFRLFNDKDKKIVNAINDKMKNEKVKHIEIERSRKNEFDILNHNEKIKFEKEVLDKKRVFDAEKQEYNNKIDEFEKSFLNGNPESVVDVFETLAQDLIINKVIQDLLNDEQFDNAEDYIDTAFDDNSKTLVINTTLPSQNYISREIEYRYVATKDEITSKAMKDKDFNKLYDSILSQIVLLYAKLAFNAISENIMSCIVINGYVRGIDPSTGKKLNNCVVSVSILREKFKEIDFEHIEPIQCLKFFKARIASEFINISPVNPILEFDKNDSRFISAENVIDNFENNTNLATMDWEKFEYLVRDLFGKMFSEHGGEVKITQASRDKGVDAIVFDPDPIRGGKFVIQCKRYNNVVGVSDVRDLWGTVMHEGASKGILVTTSHFGADSIEWTKDKPITLINGQNLLSLFQKYGYDFKIELQR